MKVNFCMTMALMVCSELAAAGAVVGGITVRTDGGAYAAQQWLDVSCTPTRDDRTKNLCGPAFEVTKVNCQKHCSCLKSSDSTTLPDSIRCPPIGTCDYKQITDACECTGAAGTGACGNGGFGLG